MDIIEKLETLKNWCDWMDYGFVAKIKTLSDAEKLYDFCQSKELEFIDWECLCNNYDTEAELHDITIEIENIVGYKLY